MQKLIIIVLGVLAFAGVLYFKHVQHGAAVAEAERRANDDHAVHITMKGHSYVIPRYFLVTSSADDMNLQDSPPKGNNPGQPASIDLAAALPGFTPVANAERRPPYGGKPDTRVLVSIINRIFEPKTLADYTGALKTPFTIGPAPSGLTQEDDPSFKGKTAAHHYFGVMLGRQLMITCYDAPGLSCIYDFPVKDTTVEVSFAKSQLPQWYTIYPASVQFVTKLQVN